MSRERYLEALERIARIDLASRAGGNLADSIQFANKALGAAPISPDELSALADELSRRARRQFATAAAEEMRSLRAFEDTSQ